MTENTIFYVKNYEKSSIFSIFYYIIGYNYRCFRTYIFFFFVKPKLYSLILIWFYNNLYNNIGFDSNVIIKKIIMSYIK